MKSIQPSFLKELTENLERHSEFIQVILGPRQVGKTTGIQQFLAKTKLKSLYFSADDEFAPAAIWLEEKWQEAQLNVPEGLLVIDEVQKIPRWSSVVKSLWDRQKRSERSKIRMILLGSSSLQIQYGLDESLTGRFQLIRAVHWGYSESKKLANLSVEDFAKFGGYPGSYSLLEEKRIWEKYILDSIVSTVIGKDILNMARVSKPALFRQAFSILMAYPAQEISYTKLLGQLQDSGNTDLVKHYIELYEGAYLIKALQKYSGRRLVTKSSSPKLLPLCGALIDRSVFSSAEGFGRTFEAMVGACLVNHGFEPYYWRDGNAEVDYVFEFEGSTFAIEVKSGRKKSTRGIDKFTANFKKARPLFITFENIEKFLKEPREFFKQFL